AQRFLDSARGLCAIKLAGWTPLDLIENNDREARRDRAEGVRLAYVAATRARDLLVVPAIGDAPFEDGWASPLNSALYPDIADRQSPRRAIGAPPFKSKDTLLDRPDGETPGSATMRPGEYSMADRTSGETFSVVWWDPVLLDRPGDDTRGLRRDDLIAKDARPEDVAFDRDRYESWQRGRAALHERAAQPSLRVMTATEFVQLAASGARAGQLGAADVEIVDAGVVGPRPSGRRFGVLVHALLAAVPMDATADQIRDMAALQARVLAATDNERDAAAAIVERTLKHRLLDAARAALAAGRACRREAAISIVRGDTLVDGQIDLAFETSSGWQVIDFKTDAELGGAEDVYRRQVALYASALQTITGRPAAATILRV
ncbi:MAG: PD-(D/E)XK nuclease family protein, partial [Bryobacteraceae bacterium]